MNEFINQKDNVGENECIGCGKVFYTLVFKEMENDNKFCSPKCEENHSIFNTFPKEESGASKM